MEAIELINFFLYSSFLKTLSQCNISSSNKRANLGVDLIVRS